VQWRLQAEVQRLGRERERLRDLHPHGLLASRRQGLLQAQHLLQALSPEHQLARGFSLLRSPDGTLVRSIRQLHVGSPVITQLSDGRVDAVVSDIQAQALPYTSS
jgi:exodeoxyribonuclease VII large subunit